MLRSAVADRLDELGFKAVGGRGLEEVPYRETMPIVLSHEHGEAEFYAGWADKLTVSSMDWLRPQMEQGKPVLVFGPRMTERSAKMLRHLGINYLDSSGNAYISFPGVYVDVRGRREGVPDGSAVRGGRGGVNLFSEKRAQVVFVLLAWPQLLEATVRQIAQTAGVSVGQAQATLTLLKEYGYLGECRSLLKSQRQRLIDHWVAAFPMGIGASSNSHDFVGDWVIEDLFLDGVTVGGEAVVSYLRNPETVVLYVDKFPDALMRRFKWRAARGRANISVRDRFWRPNTELVNSGDGVAHRLLVYADLLASGDARLREAAENLRGELD